MFFFPLLWIIGAFVQPANSQTYSPKRETPLGTKEMHRAGGDLVRLPD